MAVRDRFRFQNLTFIQRTTSELKELETKHLKDAFGFENLENAFGRRLQGRMTLFHTQSLQNKETHNFVLRRKTIRFLQEPVQ